jgi:hypothetical protein
MNNKRIHELVGFLKKRNAMYSALQAEPKETQPFNPWDMGRFHVYEEILQYLLEEDIKRNGGRLFCHKHGIDYEMLPITGTDYKKFACPLCYGESKMQETKNE